MERKGKGREGKVREGDGCSPQASARQFRLAARITCQMLTLRSKAQHVVRQT